MFCPKCGKPLPSGEQRFCASCGQPLGELKVLEAGAGDNTHGQKIERSQMSPQQRGVRFGGLLMLIGLLLAPLAYLLSALVVDKMIYLIVVGALFFLVGACRMMYAALIEESRGKPLKDSFSLDSILNRQDRNDNFALPPRRATFEDYILEQRTTGELTPPTSVTERTTRLFDTNTRKAE
jgi:hypothetical protein